jgi:hypothetical protein
MSGAATCCPKEGCLEDHLSHIPAHKFIATVAPFRAWRGSQLFIAGGPRWRAHYTLIAGQRIHPATLGNNLDSSAFLLQLNRSLDRPTEGCVFPFR